MNNLCFLVFVLHMYASVLSFRKFLEKCYPAGLNVSSWAALCLRRQSFIECHLPFFQSSNFHGRLMQGCLVWVLNFIFAFTSYPFLLFSVFSLLPEKALLLYILAECSQGRSFASDSSADCSEYPLCSLGGPSNWQPMGHFSCTE